MNFELNQSIEILRNTPFVVESYLSTLSTAWIKNNEGESTWSAYDVLAHLIDADKTNWMIRVKTILSNADNKRFEPFDRFAHLNRNQELSLDAMIKEFQTLRKNNLDELVALNITEKDLDLVGVHPALGEVSLRQLLATWTVHDLGHLGQISRVMAKQYSNEVGPWVEYLRILRN